MVKRLTATEKWDDPWFFELDDKGKLAWLYLLDKCDHAGIYDPNPRLMEAYLGAVPDIEWFKGRVIVLEDGKWFIPKFIEFQQHVPPVSYKEGFSPLGSTAKTKPDSFDQAIDEEEAPF